LTLKYDVRPSVDEYLIGLTKMKKLAAELADNAANEWAQDSFGEVYDWLEEQEQAANGMLAQVGRA
jgi:hypothetical protein